jgi:ABC-type thiamine transport system substrate-binding protein
LNKYFRINKVALALLITLTSCIQSDNTESSLVIYSGRQESLVSEIFTKFTNETGIKVEVRYAKSNELAGTIILEGENSPADIFYSQDPVSLSLVASEGLFDNISESTLEKVPSWAVDSNGLWVGVSGRSRSLVVKSSYQLDNEVPNSLYDLNQEKYRGLSRRAKKLALSMIVPTFTLTIYYAFSLVGDIIFGSFGLGLCLWLATRPEPPIKSAN